MPVSIRGRKKTKMEKCVSVSAHTRTLRRTTKGSPSGGEGRADSEAVRHVAVATQQGWDVAGREPRRAEEEGGKVKHCSIQLAADKEDDDDDDASLRLRGG